MRHKPLLCIAMGIVFIPATLAGTLRVGVPQVTGDNVVLPVLLDGDIADGVAALDFTLQYDPAVFEPVGAEASSNAQAARKQVQSNEVSPGNYVVMMYGMNQTTLQTGEIASIVLSMKTQPDSNQSNVSIIDTAFASTDGFEIISQGSSQTVTFAPPPTDGGDNNPPPTQEPTVPDDDPVLPRPVPEPETPAPGAPPLPGGTPGGSPNPGGGEKPGADPAPRGMPIAVASPGSENAPLADTASRLAKLNAASKQLASARESLNAPAGNAASGSLSANEEQSPGGDDAQEAKVMETASRDTGSAPNANVTVAAATPSLSSNPAAPVVPPPSAVSDSSGISARGKYVLMGVASCVAIALLAVRFSRRAAK